MKPISTLLGIDLAKLRDAQGDLEKTPFVPPRCPGARVYITRDDLKAMVQGGEEFESEGTDVPKDGYGHARVRCGRDVERKMGVAGHVVYFGLCHSCSKLEADNRADLHARTGGP